MDARNAISMCSGIEILLISAAAEDERFIQWREKYKIFVENLFEISVIIINVESNTET